MFTVELKQNDQAGAIHVLNTLRTEERVHFLNSPMESSLPGPFNQRVMVHKSSKTFSVNFMERAHM